MGDGGGLRQAARTTATARWTPRPGTLAASLSQDPLQDFSEERPQKQKDPQYSSEHWGSFW